MAYEISRYTRAHQATGSSALNRGAAHLSRKWGPKYTPPWHASTQRQEDHHGPHNHILPQ
jgi:hypothetical protein